MCCHSVGGVGANVGIVVVGVAVVGAASAAAAFSAASFCSSAVSAAAAAAVAFFSAAVTAFSAAEYFALLLANFSSAVSAATAAAFACFAAVLESLWVMSPSDRGRQRYRNFRERKIEQLSPQGVIQVAAFAELVD